jgi:hypothetical protein
MVKKCSRELEALKIFILGKNMQGMAEARLREKKSQSTLSVPYIVIFYIVTRVTECR